MMFASFWLKLNAAPIDYLLLDDLPEDEPNNNEGDYDMTYDQRQNGTENIRLRIDGVLIAFPSSVSSSAGSMASNAAANYLLQLAAAAEDDDSGSNESSDSSSTSSSSGSGSGSSSSTGNFEDYFGLWKNTNEVKVTPPSLAAESTTKEKKKVPTRATVKESEIKRVTIMKDVAGIKYENNEDNLGVKTAAVSEEQQTMPSVMPVKKVQSRRRNK